MEDEARRGSVLDEFDYVAPCPEERSRQEAHERLLYADLLEDVLFLRRRGFTVYLDGRDDDGYPALICDGKPITADDVRAKAARERSLT